MRLVSAVHADAAALHAAAGAVAAAIAARSPLAVAGTKRVLLHSRCAPLLLWPCSCAGEGVRCGVVVNVHTLSFYPQMMRTTG